MKALKIAGGISNRELTARLLRVTVGSRWTRIFDSAGTAAAVVLTVRPRDRFETPLGPNEFASDLMVEYTFTTPSGGGAGCMRARAYVQRWAPMAQASQ